MLDTGRIWMLFAAGIAGCAPPAQSAPPAYAAPGPGAGDDDGDGDDGSEDDEGDADGDTSTYGQPQPGWPAQPGMTAGTGGDVAVAGGGQVPAPASGGGPAAPGGGVRSDDCRTQLLAPNPSGGCRIRLVTPSTCETVDLSGGRTYEVAWTTDGSGCETPWTIQVAGNPITPDNIRSVQLSTNVERGITRQGGLLYITAADLAGLRSDNGLYHWSVQSHYGAHPGTTTFSVRR